KGEELPHIYTFKIIDQHGHLKWLEINTVLITWEGRPATLNFLSDITERKLVEEELSRYRDQLEEFVKERTVKLINANEQLQVEITERKLTEEQLKTSLKEKELLLQEIHHRVKNNLTVISSLFSLSSRRSDNPEVIGLLREAQAKIYTMALIHSQLYDSGNFDAINMEEYIRKLVAYLSQMYDLREKRITFVIQHSDVTLSLTQAIPCALVLNELISNVFKHAFQERESGTFEIAMKQSSYGAVTIRVKDDGSGIPQEIDLDRVDSLGFKLVRNLVRIQLRGTMQIQRHQGTEVIVEFNLNEEDKHV
ncbi:MAG: histidine kinase dimerization/phosphoacceptor domain -containing protein, partial [Planctomycetota bacterium]